MSTKSIKNLRNYRILRQMQARRIKKLNDFYIEVLLTVNSLKEMKNSISQRSAKNKYLVPKLRGGVREVPRKTSEIIERLDERIDYSEFSQSIIFSIAMSENFILETLRFALISYPEKILISCKGNEGERSIDLKNIISKNDIGEIISEQAMARLNQAMYSSPKQFEEYFKKVTGFGLGESFESYIELKATRDLLVHNDGYINEIYLQKAGDSARGALGERISIDSTYFEEAIRHLKKLSSVIYRGQLDKFGESQPYADVLEAHIS